MRRRDFIALLGSAAAWPHAARAQQPDRLRQIGVVIQGDVYHVGVDGLREGLKAVGLEEGQQIALLVRDAKGNLAAVEAAARDFERDGVDLIVAFATSVALAAKRSTAKVPIVFVTGSDPAALGLVDTLARPGGRLTGVHSISPAFPRLTAHPPAVQGKIAHLTGAEKERRAFSGVKTARLALRKLGQSRCPAVQPLSGRTSPVGWVLGDPSRGRQHRAICLGRSSSIMARMRRNRAWGTATSANWKAV